jgi:hypothetical protein
MGKGILDQITTLQWKDTVNSFANQKNANKTKLFHIISPTLDKNWIIIIKKNNEKCNNYWIKGLRQTQV